MSRYFPIKSCNECPHKDHSGSFTPGGAFPVCSAVPFPNNEKKPENYTGTAAILPWKPDTRPYCSGRTYTGEIPGWCPLPKVPK